MSWEVRQGDCVESMRAMPAGSVDAVVCDPPYGIGFMGKEWDGQAIAEAARLDRERRKSLGPESPSRPGRAQPRSASAFGNEAIIAGPVRGGADFQAWCEAWATEALRVLKPGGHLLAFGGTRTYHRLVCAVEDAGFEIRDTISWLYGSGFPKSLDVSKAIDRAAGAEREVVGEGGRSGTVRNAMAGDFAGEWDTTAPATPEAERWQGWGTALKPAHEPVVVARKPLSGTVSANVLEHSTGALNVDGCRVGTAEGDYDHPGNDGIEDTTQVYGTFEHKNQMPPHASGRWPANVVLSHSEGCVPGECEPGCAVRLLDEQTGELHGAGHERNGMRDTSGDPAGMFPMHGAGGNRFGDTGGASRFFFTAQTSDADGMIPPCDADTVDESSMEAGGPDSLRFAYVAKASRGERNAGLDGFEEKRKAQLAGAMKEGELDDVSARYLSQPMSNVHPTVKPIELMRWLVRLVTPPGGTCLDPFCGSGSTGCAAVLEGFDFVGLEREEEYVQIARARIGWWEKHRGDGKAAQVLAAGEVRDATASTGQLDMFGGAA